MMDLVEVAPRVHACIRPDRGLGWSNSGLVATGGGLVVDSFYDLPSTRALADLYATVLPEAPRRLLNTHHNGDHCWGNQVFEGAEIIGHRLCAENMFREVGPEVITAMCQSDDLPPFLEHLAEGYREFDFEGITLTPPTTFVEERMDLGLDEIRVELHHVGPAHTGGDVVAWLPDEGVLFCGDILFNQCTPIGWDGTFDGWIGALERLIAWAPETVVPGHGPLCGVEGLAGMRDYLVYVRDESREHWEAGRTVLEACRRIDLGPYAAWNEPWRLPSQVARAYRELDGIAWDEPFDVLAVFSDVDELRREMLGSAEAGSGEAGSAEP
ncbi:MAG TPA: MBL fold metallo-hydrolase [Microthrixaceae bacterium]|nr:MBL fold metallo-hydrolase [Microthrixaceae bacterium]